MLCAAGIKCARAKTAGAQSVLVFVGQAWRWSQPTNKVSCIPSLSATAADLLSSQGEEAFEHEFGMFYVKHVYDGGFLSMLYNFEYR